MQNTVENVFSQNRMVLFDTLICSEIMIELIATVAKQLQQVQEELNDINVNVQRGDAIIINAVLKLTAFTSDDELCVIHNVHRK